MSFADFARFGHDRRTAAGWLTGAARSVSAWNDARRTRRALSQLSLHELDDIGLTPADIDEIARRGF